METMRDWEWSKFPMVLSVREVAGIMGIGMSSAYRLVQSEGFPVVRVGKVIKVPRDNLRAWIENRQDK